jgi:hypothetical protein
MLRGEFCREHISFFLPFLLLSITLQRLLNTWIRKIAVDSEPVMMGLLRPVSTELAMTGKEL